MLVAKTPAGWLIILKPDNLARMKAGDPVTIPDLGLMICYEELADDKLMQALQGDAKKYLTRGWQNHPDDYRDAVKVGEAEFKSGKEPK